MDNLTHTIVGLAVGAAIHRAVAPEPADADRRTRGRLALTACALASNFPDLDLLLTRMLPAPLGYLLDHRGHTHTFLLEIPQALLLCALLWLLWPAARRLLAASGRARAVLAASVVIGLVLHISMDFLNSYGVHPFYPFDNDWRFGDMVFIIEPVFWVGAGLPLILSVRRRGWRLAWLVLLIAVLAACVPLGFLHWESLVVLGALAAVIVAAGRTGAGAGAGAGAGLALCAAFIGVQAFASHSARAMLERELAARAPDARLVDAALTAYPANPLCWNVVAIEQDPGSDNYRIRRSVLTLAPALLPLSACPTGLTGKVKATALATMALQEQAAGSLSALRARAQSDCYFAAWLRFARAPLLNGDVAADLRFGTTLAPNFSTIDLAAVKGRTCPLRVPPWGMPRADLLRP